MNACPTRFTSGDSAGAFDRLGHGPARAHVVDHLLARRLGEHRLGEERGHEVAGDELAHVVDEEAAVGVAVVRDSEIGGLLLHLRDDELAILGEEGIRLVVREAPVGLEVTSDDLELRRRSSTGGSITPAIPFAASTTTRSGRIASDVDEREHLLDEARPDVLARARIPAARPIRSPPRRACGSRRDRSRLRPGARRAGRSSSPCTPSGCATR